MRGEENVSETDRRNKETVNATITKVAHVDTFYTLKINLTCNGTVARKYHNPFFFKYLRYLKKKKLKSSEKRQRYILKKKVFVMQDPGFSGGKGIPACWTYRKRSQLSPTIPRLIN